MHDKAIYEEVVIMTRKLQKAEWRPFFDTVSKLLEAKVAEIEVASLDLGDQIQAEWLPLIGITYDPNDDVVEVALDGLDHMIHRPREIYMDNEGRQSDEPRNRGRGRRQADREAQGSAHAASAGLIGVAIALVASRSVWTTQMRQRGACEQGA